jgi:hypothetical protein
MSRSRPGNPGSAESAAHFRLKNAYSLNGEGRLLKKLGFVERSTGDNGRYQKKFSPAKSIQPVKLCR